MTLKARSEREYVSLYMQTLQGLVGFSPRELEIAVEMVLVYRRLTRTKNAFKLQKSRDEFDVDKELRSPVVLEKIVSSLSMSFPVFRNYITSMKKKGFFDKGSIHKKFIPGESETIIKVVLDV